VLRCRRCGFLTLKTGIDESQLFDSYQDYLPLDAAAIGGTAIFGPIGTLGSRGIAALSEVLEIASGARLSLPGLTKTTFGYLPATRA